jgi:hypothetical protein
LDLNTPESTHTCNKLIEVALAQGFKISVLADTIEESKRLFHVKAEFFDKAFLQGRINPEDIYNACYRRNLSRTDLERIGDNLESLLIQKGAHIIHETKKYQNQAKFSKEFEALKKVRNSDWAALHDATAMYYVRAKRKKKIKSFENVNCWFVNNSTSDNKLFDSTSNPRFTSSYQPESIKADDLLNILWLSNPNIAVNIPDSELADIGITTLISCTINETLPKSSIIRELDDNIQKYAKDELSDNDVLRVASRIATRQLRNIDKLNTLAEKSPEKFVQRLRKESQKQEKIEREKKSKLHELFVKVEKRGNELIKAKEEFENKSTLLDKRISNIERASNDQIEEVKRQVRAEKVKRLNHVNETRKEKRGKYISGRIRAWRQKSWIELFIFILILLGSIIYIAYHSNWDMAITTQKIRDLNSNIISAYFLF